MSHSSVSTTVRAAKDYGYRCTLVDAACATRDIPTPEGGVLSAQDLHRAELAALGDNFAAVVAQAQALV
ncbi:Isochorismatase family protein [compost metagenome]